MTPTATAVATAPRPGPGVLTGPVRRSRRGVVRLCLVGLVAYLVVGNAGILVASLWARQTTAVPASAPAVGVGNFQVVDDRLWRGAAPSARGYRWLASQGVRTVIDLRAEEDIDVDEELLAGLGLELVALPMRDGQAPGPALVAQFRDAVGDSTGLVFVHCGAGVGRTGTMVASYLVETGKAGGWSAVRRNLAVGPPSLEQIAYAANLAGEEAQRPAPVVVALSRVLDAPRRLWVRLRPY